MTDRRNVSGISDHKLRKGALVTPLNAGAGDKLLLSSWTKERMPEYLWLGLILLRYGRKSGVEKAGSILFEISRKIETLSQPRLSKIFGLSDDEQKLVYEIICRHVDKDVLAPLTILYPSRLYPLFNDYFFVSHLLVEDRINTISEAIKLFSPHQSNEATDLRFLALSLMLFGGKIHFAEGMKAAITALQEYPYTDHEDEKMRMYRPTVRSMEGMNFEEEKADFSSKFWRDFGMLTPCNPIRIEFPENTTDYKEFEEDCQKVLEYVFDSNKEKSLTEDKFGVILGSINYARKIFSEISDNSLGNSILGRHGIRTIIEVYIILKYLLKKESEKRKIWEEYKLYGVSKYKLVLLKARESNSIDMTSHFSLPFAEALVNEILWEEFIDVDLNYFDKQGIRDKSIDVGEKELYDLFYDYDSSYAHGLWGAVRESSMLHCNSANHQFHAVPDIYDNQNLPDVKSDSYKIMILLYTLLAGLYDIPAWFADKYFVAK
ncbi:MAG: hypothetical protein IPP66_18155 [Anaerolineales bacterium]|nr:hypothetical protein [Anaerolineales bacterium]